MLTAPRLIQDPARRHGYALAVALILLISTALRLWQLSTPAEMMFDEIYYAKDAKAIVDGRVGTEGQYRWAAGDEVSWPHPEMGKFAIAAGILLFGDRSFGWRIPAVIAGIALLACVYPLGRRLGLSPPWALLALLFAAADPLGIAQSRIATLDIFIAVWTVVCILCVLSTCRTAGGSAGCSWRALSGGMAAATKWSGGLAIVAAALDHRRLLAAAAAGRAERRGGSARGRGRRDGRGRLRAGAAPCAAHAATGGAAAGAGAHGSAWRRIGLVVAALVVVPVGIYMLSYAQYFVAGHTWADFVELHRQAVHFNLSLRATHTYASIAPGWIIDYRPVWYFFEGKKTYHGVIAIGNPFLWWTATALPAAGGAADAAAADLRAAAGGGHRGRPLRAVVRHFEDVVPLLHDAGGAVHGHPRGHGALPARLRRRPAPGLALDRRRGARHRRPLAPGRHRRRLAVLDAAAERQRRARVGRRHWSAWSSRRWWSSTCSRRG